ncbi:MAG: ParB/RepB/Spo0J family partition protein [Bacilli bacterium]|nr:ParB/RepB/Spo0J family partition protein [Bacilli bacterium]
MNTENTNDQVVQLYLDDIIPNRFQPREVFDEKALKELAVSIKEHGVIQPIIVRNVKGKYEIIAGERRYKASALAGLTKIPAIIRDLDDKESSKVALLENLQRKNLTPIEEARTYQKILEIDEMTQEDLARTMGKSQSAVANKLRLLSLPDDVQDSLLKEQISERHARALLNIPEASQQTEMLKKIINNKMSVRAVEEEIKRLYSKEDNEGVGNMENQSVGIPESISIPSTKTFINSNPLMPTNDIPNPQNTGISEISSIPPIGPGLPGFVAPQVPTSPASEPAKFINYAEIDDDDDEEPPMQFNNPVTSIDVNSIRNSAVDIGTPKEEKSMPSADLDSLLNLQNVSAGPSVGNLPGVNSFLSPAEEIVKTDASKPMPKEKAADYFKTADFIPNVPSMSSNPTMNLGIPEITSQGNYDAETALQKLRDTISDLKAHGVRIHADEMNFETSYQIIIKLDK